MVKLGLTARCMPALWNYINLVDFGLYIYTGLSAGVRYNIENGGFPRIPGGVIHAARLPADSRTFNIEDSACAG
jgi:hypothetical protein